MKTALDGCVSFNCQLGILQAESLGGGVSRSGWPSDKTMKNSILIAGLRCEGPPILIRGHPLAGNPGFCEGGEN